MTDNSAAYIATGIAMATIIANMAVMQSRTAHSETPAPAYLVIGTSPNPKTAQTVTAIRYESRSECDAKVTKLVLHDTGPKQVTVIVPAHCTDQRPSFWVENN